MAEYKVHPMADTKRNPVIEKRIMAAKVHPMADTEVTGLGPGTRADKNVADGDNDNEQKPNGEDNDSGEADDALCPKEGCSCGELLYL